MSDNDMSSSTFVLLGVSIILSNRNNSQLYIRCFSMFTGLAELSKIFKLCKPLTSTEQVYIAQEPYIIISISLSMVAHQDKCLVILARSFVLPSLYPSFLGLYLPPSIPPTHPCFLPTSLPPPTPPLPPSPPPLFFMDSFFHHTDW